MLATLKSGSALAVLVCIGVGSMTAGASAVTAEVAKKCEDLTLKAYPLRQPTNPAAGSTGSAADQRSFYKRCVENGGNMSAAPETDRSAPPSASTLPARKDAVAPKSQENEEHYTYKPCPASVAINGRELCLGGSARDTGGARSRQEGQDYTYKPCPASVAMNGRELCLGGPARDTGGARNRQKDQDYTYKPCPASVAINGRELCLGGPARDTGGGGRKGQDYTYKPCPASVAINGRNRCIG
jgi:hypothetical protein